MKRLFVCLLIIVWLPTSAALAKEAAVYFDLASKSSSANKKIEYYSKALELDPNLASAYAKRGILFYFQGKYQKVIEDFENYTRLRPDDGEGYRMLGMGYLYAGTYDAAIATFNQALKIDPHLTSALCYRAEAYRRSGQNEKAISDSTEAIQLGRDPRILADAYITRAKVYRELGLQDKAFADIRAALLKDPRTYFYRHVCLQLFSPCGLLCSQHPGQSQKMFRFRRFFQVRVRFRGLLSRTDAVNPELLKESVSINI